jgi:hypothetical protein
VLDARLIDSDGDRVGAAVRVERGGQVQVVGGFADVVTDAEDLPRVVLGVEVEPFVIDAERVNPED